MDVDAMSIEEQNELMKKGACFRCKKTGHLGKDCPTRNEITGTTQEVQKKMTPKEMYKHIQSLTAQLNDEEKDGIFQRSQRKGLKRRTRSMLVSPSLNIYFVTVGNISNNTLFIPFKTVTKEKNVETQAMIDCGAGGAFIDQNFAKNFEQKKLDHPLTAKNVNGTINKKGTI